MQEKKLIPEIMANVFCATSYFLCTVNVSLADLQQGIFISKENLNS